MSKMRSGPHCTSDSRRHQLGGPVASKLDCHRDKNLLLGDFYHSQLWWTLACCHRRTGGKIEDEGEECGNDDTLVADKRQLWKPRKNVKKSRKSLLIWVRSLSNLVRNSLNNRLRLNLIDVPLVLRLFEAYAFRKGSRQGGPKGSRGTRRESQEVREAIEGSKGCQGGRVGVLGGQGGRQGCHRGLRWVSRGFKGSRGRSGVSK